MENHPIPAVSPFTPEFYRQGRPIARREIPCRRCAREMRHDPATDRWHHLNDDSLACVDPGSLLPYSDDELDASREEQS